MGRTIVYIDGKEYLSGNCSVLGTTKVFGSYYGSGTRMGRLLVDIKTYKNV